MSEQYFVFTVSEDGDMSIEALDAATLRARLDENYYGEGVRVLDSLTESNPMYWGGERTMLIVKGSIVNSPS